MESAIAAEKKKLEELENNPDLDLNNQPTEGPLDYQKGIEQNEATLKVLKRELALFRKQYDFNVKQRAQFEAEVSKQKKRIKLINQAKKTFYLYLLKQGFDSRYKFVFGYKITRNDGLTWILKELFREKENLTADSFPDFLDIKSKSFLIQVPKSNNFSSNRKLKSFFI